MMGKLDGFALDHGFLLQDAQGRQVIFDFLEAGQHRLLVHRNAGVVGGNCLIALSASCAAVKQGGCQGRSERPDAVGDGQPVGKAVALKSARSRQGQIGKVGSLGHADLGIGRRCQPFRRADIRATFQQRRGHADRNIRQHCNQRRRCNRKGGRRLPGQQGDRVFQLRTQHAIVQRLRLGASELGLGLNHVRPGDHADGILVLRQLQRFLIGSYGVVEQVLLLVEHPQLQIVLRHGGLGAEPGHLQVGGAGLG